MSLKQFCMECGASSDIKYSICTSCKTPFFSVATAKSIEGKPILSVSKTKSLARREDEDFEDFGNLDFSSLLKDLEDECNKF